VLCEHARLGGSAGLLTEQKVESQKRQGKHQDGVGEHGQGEVRDGLPVNLIDYFSLVRD